MNHLLSIRLAVVSAILMTSLQFPAFSQTKADSIEATAATSTKSRYFTLGANYGTNTTFYGRTTGYKRPYTSVDFTYSSKTGFWLSSSVFEVMNTEYFIDGTDISTGWNFDITKKIDASLSYSRYFFSSQSSMMQSVTSNLAASHIGLDWYYLYSSLAASSIFGGANDYFITFSNSRYFERANILSKKDKDYISIEPRVSVIAGTQNFANTYITSQNNDTQYYAPVTSMYPTQPGQPSMPGSGTSSTQPAETDQGSSGFNILNYELRVPVTYTYGSASLETTWSYVKPVNLLAGDNSQAQSIFSVSLFYIIKSK
jgi:hypothetical protein